MPWKRSIYTVLLALIIYMINNQKNEVKYITRYHNKTKINLIINVKYTHIL